ncbi:MULTISPECIES: helix-turn-helix transcriptional regulator [unclassified Streptomyces]|uniref:helix-turn-helix transcriptional regulator n=1 Tax=unclassified Streptomyces TaxID=2593676 RepID=UPI001F446168|nr:MULTISPECIES: helix-turn-helix transcriptional regulator [unclassified Streptomyces]
MTTRTRPRPVLSRWDMPHWMPDSSQTLPARCGEDFTAIRVPADLARPALTALGPRTGPVLANKTTRTWHFLLPSNSVLPDDWPHGVRVMPKGRSIGIPPLTTTGGLDVHWAVPPGLGSTSPADLHRALHDPRLLTAGDAPSPADPPAAAAAVRAAAPPTPRPLTRAQRDVGRLLLTGASDAQIAEELGLPVGTVRRHLTSIGRRFGAPTAARRAAALLAGGHVSPPPVSMLAPDLSETDLIVLRVLAGLATEDDLPEDLRTGLFLDHVDELRERCGARTDPHLIALAAFWELLPDLANPAPGKEQLP